MKCCSFLFAALFLLAVSINASAQDATPQADASPNKRGKFAQMDKNGDGLISQDEWTRNSRAFARIDLNKDGLLSHEELIEASKKYGGKGRKKLAQMDTNGDGKIARDEWSGKAKAFDRLDANHDGYLSQDEITPTGQQ